MRLKMPPLGGLFGGTSELTWDDLRLEVRPNDDGTIDEVLIYRGPECVFHLEQMADDHYWFAWYGDGMNADRHFDIRRKGKRVTISER